MWFQLLARSVLVFIAILRSSTTLTVNGEQLGIVYTQFLYLAPGRSTISLKILLIYCAFCPLAQNLFLEQSQVTYWAWGGAAWRLPQTFYQITIRHLSEREVCFLSVAAINFDRIAKRQSLDSATVYPDTAPGKYRHRSLYFFNTDQIYCERRLLRRERT